MTVLARRDAAATSDRIIKHWRLAEPILDEWIAVGTATAPADRTTAEHLIAGIYARHHRDRPEFRWVASPMQALPLLAGLPTHEDLHTWVRAHRPQGTPPLASDIATGLARLRGTLDTAAAHPDLTHSRRKPGKGTLPPAVAVEEGLPLREVLRQALHTPLAAGLTWPIRSALGARSLPVCWYGQQDATWIGFYDVLQRVELAWYGTRATDELGQWAALARSCGWWWPGEDVCVVVDRPAAITARGVRHRDGTVNSW